MEALLHSFGPSFSNRAVPDASSEDFRYTAKELRELIKHIENRPRRSLHKGSEKFPFHENFGAYNYLGPLALQNESHFDHLVCAPENAQEFSLNSLDHRLAYIEAGMGAKVSLELSKENGLEVIYIDVAEGAKLEFFNSILNADTPSFMCLRVRQEKNSSFTYREFLAANHYKRIELDIELLGPGASVSLKGSTLTRGTSDHFISLKHLAPNTKSEQVFFTAAIEEAKSVFQGRVFVERNCNGVESKQLSKGLLMGARGKIHTRPILEVYSADVKCTHGAAIGGPGKEEIFYLESRGFSLLEAKRAVLKGKLSEVFSDIENEKIKKNMQNKVTEAILTCLN